MKKKWQITSRGNFILEGDGFDISYNPSADHELGGAFKPDTLAGETALVNSNDKIEYRILNGDFRKEYEKVIDKGFKACLAVYNKHKKLHNSSWTSM